MQFVVSPVGGARIPLIGSLPYLFEFVYMPLENSYDSVNLILIPLLFKLCTDHRYKNWHRFTGDHIL